LRKLSWQRAEEKLAQKVGEGENALDRLLSRRAQLVRERDEYNIKIRELGSIPVDAFSKSNQPPPLLTDASRYAATSLAEIQRLLGAANASLRRFEGVNKRAMEQFVTFTEQRESFEQRRDELRRSGAAIERLIESLDQRKDDATELTFKLVAKHFVAAFGELVPGGKGELVMKMPSHTPEGGGARLSHYVGVGIRVGC
jgi:structural maintenance of chromosome 3 (chondroitin sulfate proteoglycan 6)